MSNQNITKQCKEQIKVACHVLCKPYDAIKSLHQHKEITEIIETTYSYKRKINRVIDINFENARLNCLFDKNNICDSSLLFFDNKTDIFHYIEYCYQTYKYYYKLHSWINKEYYIKVYTKNDEAVLHFHL